jgi:hypothetical protein
MSIAVSTWPMTRTTASPIAISIRPALAVAGGDDDGADDGEGAATTTGANIGVSAPTSGHALLLLPPRLPETGAVASRSAGVGAVSSLNNARALRRHAKSCCGESPLRRATSETLAPGLKLSITMRAFSSLDQPRRRAARVISSIRRTDVTLSETSSAVLSSLR